MTTDNRWGVFLAMAWLAGLVAIHPLPHTGALRSFLHLLGLGQVVLLVWQRRALPPLPAGGIEALLLAALTGWLLLQATLIAPTPAKALSELAHEWTKMLAVTALGIGLATNLRTPPANRNSGSVQLIIAIFLGFFAHVVLTLGYHAWQWWQSGQLPLGESALGNYGYVSPLVLGALAMLLVDAAARLCRDDRLLPLSNGGAVAAIAATLAANALLTAKAGLVMTHLLGWVFLAAVLRQGSRHRRLAIAAVVCGLAVATGASLLIQNRWSGAGNSIAAGVDSVDTQAAKSPAFQAGIEQMPAKDPSIFLRTSWAVTALEGISQHPLGLGYGADAFGRYIAEKYGVPGFISSHSGWMDFTLANGIPALALLLALAWALMRRGWLAFRSGNNAGLALALVTLNYLGRCAMDGHLTGSRLTGYALTAGVLWGLSAPLQSCDDAGSA